MLDVQVGPEDERADADDDGGLDAIGRYGDWSRNKDEGRFFIPGSLSGGDYSPGSLHSQANLNTFRKRFPRGELKWWKEVGGPHGTFAIVIDLKKVPAKRHAEVEDFFNGLADYPVADDQDLSELESEKQTEAWDDWAGHDFKRRLESKFDIEFDEVDDSKLRELFEKASDKAGEYWVNESGGDMWISVERVIEKGAITTDDIDALEATFVGEPGDDDGPGFFIVLDSHDPKNRQTEADYYESYEDAEDAAWTIHKAAPNRVEVREADTRKQAREGYGHCWWRNGLALGPPVDPRQEALRFRK